MDSVFPKTILMAVFETSVLILLVMRILREILGLVEIKKPHKKTNKKPVLFVVDYLGYSDAVVDTINNLKAEGFKNFVVVADSLDVKKLRSEIRPKRIRVISKGKKKDFVDFVKKQKVGFFAIVDAGGQVNNCFGLKLNRELPKITSSKALKLRSLKTVGRSLNDALSACDSLFFDQDSSVDDFWRLKKNIVYKKSAYSRPHQINIIKSKDCFVIEPERGVWPANVGLTHFVCSLVFILSLSVFLIFEIENFISVFLVILILYFAQGIIKLLDVKSYGVSEKVSLLLLLPYSLIFQAFVGFGYLSRFKKKSISSRQITRRKL